MKRLVRLTALVGVLTAASIAAGLECVYVEVKTARNVELTLTRGKLPVRSTDVFVLDQKSGAPKQVARGRTNERGQLVFRNLPPGRYSITSSPAPPYEFSFDITVEDRAGITQLPPLALPLPPTLPPPVKLSELSGVVVDPAGAVIPHAAVVVEEPDSTKAALAKSFTDALGRVNVQLPPGSFLVRISSPGFVPVVFPAQITSEEGASPGFRLTMYIGPMDECSASGPSWNTKYQLTPMTKD